MNRIKTGTQYAGVFLLALVLLLLGGQVLEDRPTRSEMKQAIRTQAPYVEDKKAIEERFKRQHEIALQTKSLLEENAKAMQALADALARLRPQESGR